MGVRMDGLHISPMLRCYSEIEAEDGREEACQKFKKDLGKVHKKKCHEKLRVVCSGN